MQTTAKNAGPTKVLMLCKAGGLGGMERVVARLATQLPAHGLNVRVILPSPSTSPEVPPNLLSWFHRRGVQAETNPALATYSSPNVRTMLSLANLVREIGASVVNIHIGSSSLAPMDVLAVRVAAGKRCVLSPHNTQLPRSTLHAVGKRLVAGFCDSIVVGSLALRNILLGAGISPSKLEMIPIGVPPPDPLLSRADARQRLEIPPDAFVVVCAARLVKQKGVDLLIDAVARVSDRNRRVHLVIAGDGGERAALEAAARERLHGRARFLGFVEDPDRIYAAADILALATQIESAPMVPKEAARFAVPSVSSDVGGVHESIADGETGLLVPPGDVPGLAHAIQTLMNDDQLRKQLGENAKKRVESEFSEPTMMRAYARVLQHSGKGPSARK